MKILIPDGIHDAEIWDALRAATEATDLTLAQAIIDSAGIILCPDDMSVFYDETGCLAVILLPFFVELAEICVVNSIIAPCRCKIRATKARLE
jgi:hypothetical protein